MSEQQPAQDENYVIANRREKLEKLRAAGNAYPNTFRRDTLADYLHGVYGAQSADALEGNTQQFRIAGRLIGAGLSRCTKLLHRDAGSGKVCSLDGLRNPA